MAQFLKVGLSLIPTMHVRYGSHVSAQVLTKPDCLGRGCSTAVECLPHYQEALGGGLVSHSSIISYFPSPVECP